MPRGGYNSQNRFKSPVEYVEDEGGCWVWQRGKSSCGYGVLVLEGKGVLAHRVFYERKYGAIPTGLDIDHLCRNRACVNPDHMEPVSRAINTRRGNNTKLTQRDVDEIRRRALGGENHRFIAADYGIARSTVSNIKCNVTWK